MTTNLAVIVSLTIGVFGPLFALVVTRPRPETMRATAGFCAEIFFGLILAAVLTRFVVMPALHWLGMHLP